MTVSPDPTAALVRALVWPTWRREIWAYPALVRRMLTDRAYLAALLAAEAAGSNPLGSLLQGLLR